MLCKSFENNLIYRAQLCRPQRLKRSSILSCSILSKLWGIFVIKIWNPNSLHFFRDEIQLWCQASHSGTKCLKPTRNRFISVCYIVISQFLKTTLNISVSGEWMNFIFKIRQIVAGVQTANFPKFYTNFWRVFYIWPICAAATTICILWYGKFIMVQSVQLQRRTWSILEYPGYGSPAL